MHVHFDQDIHTVLYSVFKALYCEHMLRCTVTKIHVIACISFTGYDTENK